MSEQTKPTPVALNLQDAAKTLIHVDAVMADGDTRAVFSIPKGEAALANEIYRRYNSHAALVEALEEAVADYDAMARAFDRAGNQAMVRSCFGGVRRTRAALKLAKGEA